MTVGAIVTVAAFTTALLALLFAVIACDAARQSDRQIKALRLEVARLVLLRTLHNRADALKAGAQ